MKLNICLNYGATFSKNKYENSAEDKDADEEYSDINRQSDYDDIERINRIIEEHVNDLNQMAIEYQNAEEQSVEESAKLVSDIAV